MKDLLEVRVESKIVVAAAKLPKGVTEPLTKAVEKIISLTETYLTKELNKE